MLYGFSPERRRYLPPLHGGRPGGWIEVSGPSGRFQIARHDDAGGQPGQRRACLDRRRRHPAGRAHAEGLVVEHRRGDFQQHLRRRIARNAGTRHPERHRRRRVPLQPDGRAWIASRWSMSSASWKRRATAFWTAAAAPARSSNCWPSAKNSARKSSSCDDLMHRYGHLAGQRSCNSTATSPAMRKKRTTRTRSAGHRAGDRAGRSLAAPRGHGRRTGRPGTAIADAGRTPSGGSTPSTSAVRKRQRQLDRLRRQRGNFAAKARRWRSAKPLRGQARPHRGHAGTTAVARRAAKPGGRPGKGNRRPLGGHRGRAQAARTGGPGRSGPSAVASGARSARCASAGRAIVPAGSGSSRRGGPPRRPRSRPPRSRRKSNPP